MKFEKLRERAVETAALYDRHNVAAGRREWSPEDFMMGFVGDVGDLAKLVMAVEGRREIPDARAHLGHELADCLWSVLVLAQRYDVDLPAEFARMTAEIERYLAENPPATREGGEAG
ncbi:nucleotide pyrophosphohydrolase [Actinoplanes sp. LDG1-06]|uniref:Nucleotide pyrophosphohydrolase n=1 Tax=Paractinoplanes ovalisporus TaxID=2810368 RepID=A0ABS2AGC1_9ACTN|nr:nucleotide pyrophosphohydrolase [Actinoplanes ovalisporus]MBM2618898.1 nucleotide pyrophosphohydrolase [Actinoplanes ovalisporus]